MSLPKEDIRSFLELDDGLKEARLQMKTARKDMTEHRDAIIDYMKSNDVEKLTVRKGQQFLLLTKKEYKKRPSSEVVKVKLAELMKEGVVDPERIFKEIQECGGSEDRWSLQRRSSTKKDKKEQDKDQ